jgi:hypothetical protein
VAERIDRRAQRAFVADEVADLWCDVQRTP